MSRRTNNLLPTPAPGNRRPGQGFGPPNIIDWNIEQPMFPRPPVAQNPWLPPVQERIRGGPVGLASYPVPPLYSVELQILDEMARVINRQPSRQFIPESPPRFTEQRWQNIQEEEQSRLSRDEQKMALKMLKKEIYNPAPKSTAKSLAKRLNLYYRDNAKAINSFDDEKLKAEDEDGKRCAVCLDDFEPKQLVMVTPCNHMFHEECIVPWVKSHGQCPVCRYAICERMRGNAMPLNTNNTAQIPANNLFTGDAVTILRTMDSGFDWGDFILF